MRLDPVTLLTLLGMLAVTYGARIGGYWFVRRYPVGPRLKAGLEAVPLAGIFGRAWDAIRLWIK